MSAKKKEAFQMSESTFDHLMNSHPKGVCIVDQGTIKAANSKFCSILERKSDELLEHPISMLISNEEELNKLLEFKPFATQHVFEKSGDKKQLEIEAIPLKTNSESGQYLIYLSVVDSSEANVQSGNPELDSLRSVFNLTPSLVLVLDEQTRILNINDTALKLVGKSKNKVLGFQPGDVLQCIHSSESPEGCGQGPSCKKCLIRQTVQETIQTGKSNLKIESPFTVTHANKTIDFIVEVSSIAYLHEGETRILVTLHDITHRKKLEEKLLRQKSELARKNSELQMLNTKLTNSYHQIEQINKSLLLAKEQAEESDLLKAAFLANISHEIRTPLNGILGFLDLFNDIGDASPQQLHYTRIINKSAAQLLHIVNDILEISIIETGQSKIELSEINLNELLRDFHCHYQYKLEDKPIELLIELGANDNDCTIIGDEQKLKIILHKLLDNAIKFTTNGKIEFGYKKLDSSYSFFVSDTGIGIEKEIQHKIFEHFRQAELTEHRSFGGLGLGLPIAGAWIELLGGKIQIESEPGKGSVFSFWLPKDGSKINGNEIQPENQVQQLLPKKHKTILIVEDEANNMFFLKELLKRTRAKILTATDGSEAISLCEKHTDIDLVLMDIKLPEVDGYTATRRIKAMKRKIPIIAHTAYAMAKDKQKAFEAGCDDYIPKPTPKQQMLEVIGKYL